MITLDALWAELRRKDAEIRALKAEIEIDDRLLEERRRILDVCPCPLHGPCVPHVLEVLSRLTPEERSRTS